MQTTTLRRCRRQLGYLALAIALLSARALAAVQHGDAEALVGAEVEAWADETFARLLDEYRISGGAIAVTQGDDVVLLKGYGHARKLTNEMVDEESEFRIASLSKTFLATLVAQLYERGRIESLDDPANKYLKRMQLPAYVPPGGDQAGREVTVWDLLTHRGGFDRDGVIANDPRPYAPLKPDAIIEALPAIVREPGTFSIYCNACSGALGIMVEDIVGQPLETHMEEGIFAPLGMLDSAMARGGPGPDIVTQYAFEPGKPFLALPYPAAGSAYTYFSGGVNSTARDMAKWLISNVQQGQGKGPALVSPETYRLMHDRHIGNHPDASGFGMNFFTYEYNGETVLEHYGSIQFRSLQLLMMDRKIGVFMSVAGGGPAGDRSGLFEGEPIDGSARVMAAASHSGMRALILEYFLGKLSAADAASGAGDLTRFAGSYVRIPEVPGAEPSDDGLAVSVSEDGTGLLVDGVGVYRPVDANTFVLDGTLPVETGFSRGNRYSFEARGDGSVVMFPHVNAGGFIRRPAD